MNAFTINMNTSLQKNMQGENKTYLYIHGKYVCLFRVFRIVSRPRVSRLPAQTNIQISIV
mgnify:CR=1 FL=1